MRTHLALVAVIMALTPLQGASVPDDAIDSHALDGCGYALTMTAKGALPVAAAGLKPGVSLSFENGRMLFDAGAGGICRIAFQAEAISSDVVRITSKASAALPRAQSLATGSKVSFIDVAITISGTISDDGQSFHGTLVWEERDDRAPHKVTYAIASPPPAPKRSTHAASPPAHHAP